MEENILGTPIAFLDNIIAELNLDFVMVIKNTELGKTLLNLIGFEWCYFLAAEDSKGMKTLFEKLLINDKRVSIFDYPLR